jgi:hypothetical protein
MTISLQATTDGAYMGSAPQRRLFVGPRAVLSAALGYL